MAFIRYRVEWHQHIGFRKISSRTSFWNIVRNCFKSFCCPADAILSQAEDVQDISAYNIFLPHI